MDRRSKKRDNSYDKDPAEASNDRIYISAQDRREVGRSLVRPPAKPSKKDGDQAALADPKS